MRIYFDHAATTPVDPQVEASMRPYFAGRFGNASAQYEEGQLAHKAVEEARIKVADLTGARPEEIVFTGSGTESNNMAIKGTAWALRDKGNHIITSSIEHPAVLESCRWLERAGYEVTYLPVDEYGLINPALVEESIRKETILISIMQANNEVGTIEPIAEIAEVARRHQIKLHCDAVQTVGNIAINVVELGVDMLSMSAHKLYGPKGVGALYIKEGTSLASLLHGGHQESGRRAGTENTVGMVGFGKAAELARERLIQGPARLEKMRDTMIDGIMKRIKWVRLNGHPKRRLPGNVNISIEFVEGEGMLMHLDMMGISCSTGSACQAADLKASHVLLAMGLSHEMSHGSLRFSLGHLTTEAEIARVVEVLPGIVEKLRAMSPLTVKERVNA